MDFLIISFVILGLALFVGVILFVKLKKRNSGEIKEPNYQVFFGIGICFIGSGAALTATINLGFIGITALGIIYLIIGLGNSDKWPKSKKKK